MKKGLKITYDHAGDFMGICLNCGGSQDGVEPDARNYDCEECGAPAVCGIPEAIIMGVPVSEDVDIEDFYQFI